MQVSQEYLRAWPETLLQPLLYRHRKACTCVRSHGCRRRWNYLWEEEEKRQIIAFRMSSTFEGLQKHPYSLNCVEGTRWKSHLLERGGFARSGVSGHVERERERKKESINEADKVCKQKTWAISLSKGNLKRKSSFECMWATVEETDGTMMRVRNEETCWKAWKVGVMEKRWLGKTFFFCIWLHLYFLLRSTTPRVERMFSFAERHV